MNKTISYIVSLIVLILSVVAVGENNNRVTHTMANAQYDESHDDMKAIWVSYITLDMQNSDKSKETFIKKIQSIIDKTKESGFNSLIFQVRPFCDALYNSKIYPYSHILSGTQGESPLYDPLEIICEMCHKNGISVHAWINPYRVTSKSSPSVLSKNNPYSKDEDIGFIFNDSIYLNPANDKAQKLIVDGVIEIVENYDVDGIQFDDYFYPENSHKIDDTLYNEYVLSTDNPLSKEMWRAENVNNLIKKVYKAVHSRKNNVVFGISPQGNINNNLSLGADVKKWCSEEGFIDYICPQIYFSLDNPSLTFEDCLNQWIKINKHDKLKLYIGLAGYKGGTKEDEGTWLDNDDILKTEIEICENKDTDGFMLYSYESFQNKDNENEISNVVKHLTNISQ